MLVAQTITDYLKRTNPMDKTIVFCNDIDHADRMRHALVVLNPEQVLKNEKYVMKITGDDDIGKAQLDNFINPKKTYPVIATTSELMTTGVDAQTCKLVVLDQNIQSMTKFKQIIGRGTRINERHGKLWFTILDFKKATELFADPRFDGLPEKVLVVNPTISPMKVPTSMSGWKKKPLMMMSINLPVKCEKTLLSITLTSTTIPETVNFIAMMQTKSANSM